MKKINVGLLHLQYLLSWTRRAVLNLNRLYTLVVKLISTPIIVSSTFPLLAITIYFLSHYFIKVHTTLSYCAIAFYNKLSPSTRSSSSLSILLSFVYRLTDLLVSLSLPVFWTFLGVYHIEQSVTDESCISCKMYLLVSIYISIISILLL